MGIKMIELLNYLNELDKSAIMREAHAANPQAALARFGLTFEAQSKLLTGNYTEVAESLGLSDDPNVLIQVIHTAC